jgi:putative transposase
MTIPYRGVSRAATYFVTSSTFDKRSSLQSERMAQLLVAVLSHYRDTRKFELHEYVVMPDHFHVLITPILPVTLEKAVRFIKGAFSYRAKMELGFAGEVWQTSFYDRRVRDAEECMSFRNYIYMNPVRRGLAAGPEEFLYSSARLRLDAPQWLKPAA